MNVFNIKKCKELFINKAKPEKRRDEESLEHATHQTCLQTEVWRTTLIRRIFIPALIGGLGIFLIANTFFKPHHNVMLLNPEIRFGTVRRGHLITAQVRIINMSLRRVRLLIYPSCGCTLIPSTDAAINPLHMMTIPVSIDTSDQRIGTHSKDVTFYFKNSGPTWGERAIINFTLI